MDTYRSFSLSYFVIMIRVVLFTVSLQFKNNFSTQIVFRSYIYV